MKSNISVRLAIIASCLLEQYSHFRGSAVTTEVTKVEPFFGSMGNVEAFLQLLTELSHRSQQVNFVFSDIQISIQCTNLGPFFLNGSATLLFRACPIIARGQYSTIVLSLLSFAIMSRVRTARNT